MPDSTANAINVIANAASAKNAAPFASSASLSQLLAHHAAVADFFAALGLPCDDAALPFAQWLERLPDEALLDAGMAREQVYMRVEELLRGAAEVSAQPRIKRLTLLGGRDKSGRREDCALTLMPGDIVCVVGPTGSGKSRLLADVECLAQGDTPTGRRLLIDDAPPDEAQRFAPEKKLVTQLSQNMNFVVDLSARDLIAMHANCRGLTAPGAAEMMAEKVIACANELTGEPFAPRTSVTQLSGGQTRALMIADAALLSAAPIVLIDEIENAGVDRRRALELLTGGEKIVFISTHDPLLALRGRLRLVIKNGGIHDTLEANDQERAHLTHIEAADAWLMELRERLRSGQRIDEKTALRLAATAKWGEHPTPPWRGREQDAPATLAMPATAERPPTETSQPSKPPSLRGPKASGNPSSSGSPSAESPSAGQQERIGQWLLERRSCHHLRDPGPSDDELAQMLRTAGRAPDFGGLRPYRFLAARGDGLIRLGEAMRRAAIAAGKSEKTIARAPNMPGRAPLVLIVVAAPRPDKIVSPLDQLLCAGASVLMLHLAARALGYGSVWRSGWPMTERALHDELGLAATEQIVGFLYVGAPDEAESPPPDDPDPFSCFTWI